ncbi:MAG: endolytic transglycosylase MltG [Candidatus Thiodiazotropha sp. (ex Gloverina cf. vestifex)]|nr:endolytic transglycosylase MltG [Candidatus Thiodiazotropha sp. (ex Gloverina cf. vestifex)]
MLNRLLGISIFVISILLAWGWMQYDDFIHTPLQLPEAGIHYDLKSGTTIRGVASDLQESGVISKPVLLRLVARWNGQASRLKAGEYHLPQGITPIELLDILTSARVVQHALTIIEGWTFKQLMEAVRRHESLTQTLKEVESEKIMQALGFDEMHPEGRFYPDTYHFPKGTTDVEFLQRAYHRMEKSLQMAWDKRDENLPLNTAYEALILASIIEKETGIPSERDKIAGVFVRRLKKGMRLQTDPTVIYGIGDAYDGNIRRRDLTTDTPYNTYVHKGLTPTPIAMPSGAAIEAALHPAVGNALYFVAIGNGGHHFSATLEAHNKAVRKYQLKR